MPAKGRHRLALEVGHLAGEREHDVTGLGGPDRLGPLHQDAPDLLLECLDPLAHRGRRDVQYPGRGVERAFVDHGSERVERSQVEVHMKRC